MADQITPRDGLAELRKLVQEAIDYGNTSLDDEDADRQYIAEGLVLDRLPEVLARVEALLAAPPQPRHFSTTPPVLAVPSELLRIAAGHEVILPVLEASGELGSVTVRIPTVEEMLELNRRALADCPPGPRAKPMSRQLAELLCDPLVPSRDLT